MWQQPVQLLFGSLEIERKKLGKEKYGKNRLLTIRGDNEKRGI